MIYDGLIIIRGGGDLATGTIYRLWKSGFRLLVLEAENPAAIRRAVAVSEAVFQGKTQVEDMTAVLIRDAGEADRVIDAGQIPVLVDPAGECIARLKPAAVIDAILAKRNLGTHRGMAPLTVALGPGFTAGADVDYVVETKRGHQLGRIIREGQAIPNTGIPGLIGGYGAERVIHAPASGTLRAVRKIGDLVTAGELIAEIWTREPGGNEEQAGNGVQGGTRVPVPASLTGVLRGLIRDGYPVKKGLKIADIDPRKEEQKNCFTISDKSRSIGGSVLEILCRELLNH